MMDLVPSHTNPAWCMLHSTTQILHKVCCTQPHKRCCTGTVLNHPKPACCMLYSTTQGLHGMLYILNHTNPAWCMSYCTQPPNCAWCMLLSMTQNPAWCMLYSTKQTLHQCMLYIPNHTIYNLHDVQYVHFCCTQHYLGRPPNSHSAQMYGPGLRITCNPTLLAVCKNSLKKGMKL